MNILIDFLIYIILGIILYQSISNYSTSQKIDFRIEELRNETEKLEEYAILAKKIASINNPNLRIDKQEILDVIGNEISSTNDYSIQLKKYLIAQGLLTRYTSHTSMVIDDFELVQDVITKKLMVVSSENILVNAEANKLFLNSKQLKISSDNIYKINRNQKNIFKMEKYTLNSCKTQIDTTRTYKTLNYAI